MLVVAAIGLYFRNPFVCRIASIVTGSDVWIDVSPDPENNRVFSFAISNFSREDITLVDAKTSCSCVAFEEKGSNIPLTIQPSQTREISLRFEYDDDDVVKSRDPFVTLLVQDDADRKLRQFSFKGLFTQVQN